MRALKAATIIMGVLIVVGTGALVAIIVRRSAAPPVTVAPNTTVTLQAPPGTHIAGVAAVQDRLAVQLQGGGEDRVIFVDPHSGKVTGQVTLAPRPPLR
jgi:hypothetical protein